MVLVRAPGNCREALELSCDPAAHLGPFGILQRMEDSREADPGFVGIAIGFEAAAEIAQRSEQVFVPSNQDGKLPSGGFAQRPVSPLASYAKLTLPAEASLLYAPYLFDIIVVPTV